MLCIELRLLVYAVSGLSQGLNVLKLMSIQRPRLRGSICKGLPAEEDALIQAAAAAWYVTSSAHGRPHQL